MIIECTTLEQIKDVMRVNNIENWNKTDLIKHLAKGHLCIKIYKGFGYDHRNNYKELYPELPIVSYEYYIKTITPTIHLRHAIWDSTLIVQCLHCEPFESVEKDGLRLRRNYPTRIVDSIISLYEEKGIGYHTFNTPQEAQAYLDKLLELVELVNKPVPVVDLNKTSTVRVGKYTIYTNPHTVELADEDDNAIYECKRQLPITIIKVQLEQILEHLGIKAEVRI